MVIDPATVGISTPEESPMQEDVDTIKAAEKVKEEGNVAFKAQRFNDAIDLYGKAIGAQYHVYYRAPPLILALVDTISLESLRAYLSHESSCRIHGSQTLQACVN